MLYPTKDGAPVDNLTRDDFEVLENGQPQKLEQFERILIRGHVPQEERREPNTVEEGRQAAQDPRARVVRALSRHLPRGRRRITANQKAVDEMLDRMLGPDDVIGVMTPEMSPRDMAFARKTTTVDGFLEKYWHWGERDRMNSTDPQDAQYGYCYPNVPAGDRCTDQNGIAAEMIDRRHEVRVLAPSKISFVTCEACAKNARPFLRSRMAGSCSRPNLQLMRPLKCEGVPTQPGISVDPRNGRLTTKDPTQEAASNACSIDRTNLVLRSTTTGCSAKSRTKPPGQRLVLHDRSAWVGCIRYADNAYGCSRAAAAAGSTVSRFGDAQGTHHGAAYARGGH